MHASIYPSTRKIHSELAAKIKDIQATPGLSSFLPHLAVLQVGGRQDSSLYVKMKQKAAESIGIKFSLFKLDETASQSQVMTLVNNLNNDLSVHGILVQLPLPAHMDEKDITEAVDPKKDVDG